MVFQKWSEFGFNGFHLPATPRATRSARRRATFPKRQVDNQIGAFDLLAAIAGNVVLEKENFASSTSIKNNQPDPVKKSREGKKPLKNESSCDEESCDTRCAPDLVLPYDMDYSSKGSPNPDSDVNPGGGPPILTSSCLGRSVDEKLVYDKRDEISGKLEVDSSTCAKFRGSKIDVKDINIKDELHSVGKVPVRMEWDMCGTEDLVEGKHSPAICLDSIAKSSCTNDDIPHSSISPVLDNAQIVSRDDDENSSRYAQWSTTRKSFHPVTRIGNRRIRKILASKCWKPPLKLKDKTNADINLKPILHSKDCCDLESSQMNIPFKKRKFFLHSSEWNSEGGEKSDNISYLLKKEIGGDPSGSSSKNHGVPKMSSSVATQQSSDCHVKLRIKSFRVPELFIKIPESATVGSLKRTVMEAVTTILGGGLHVGIVLQGKKVRDDSKTLLQTGISCNCEVDALGFTLEPNSTQNVTSICPAADSPVVPPLDNLKPLARCPPDPSVSYKRIRGNSVMSCHTQLAMMVNSAEGDHDSAPLISDASADRDAEDSKALVPVQEKGSEALAIMVPAQSKPRRSELVQRRIRRPFSVAEVEALVQAVEKLGTGRWRDVKLHAFNNANHRTYVDLKDKWKTLVHTARISPQQRRGEPVPQELLDRVLSAHAYWWSEQQNKQNKKQQQLETSLLF